MRLLGIAVFVLALQATTAFGADPYWRVGQSCGVSTVSSHMSLPDAGIVGIVEAHYAVADAASRDARAIGSQRQVFNWAMEARHACGTALGYWAGGVLHSESIQKCDCFYNRMISAR